MGYTTGRDLDVVGLGVSAISSIGSTYAQNEKDIERYLLEVGAGRLPIFRGFLLSPEDELRREVLQQLSCTLAVDLKDISRRFGVDAETMLARELERLDVFVDDEIVQRDGPIISVTERGRPFLRNLCMVFDEYLRPESGALEHSRTI
jgi:oxygen-independent coproporphyrinogen-3 oxidase